MGCLYVVLGSSLGANVLVQSLSKNPDDSQSNLLHYYQFMQDKQAIWMSYIDHLEEQHSQNFLDTDQVIIGAMDSFQLLLSLAQELPEDTG